MHASALRHAGLFFRTYVPDGKGLRILELGSQDVNGSLRTVAPEGADYVGVDFCPGKGVDVVIDDPYQLPFADGHADVTVTSSCFEHSEFFWLAFLELVRVTKPGGLIYVNVPSNGPFHQYPVDCWRFYPDSGEALAKWARRNGLALSLIESFVGGKASGCWNDFVAVFVRSDDVDGVTAKRMIDVIDDFTNGRSVGVDGYAHAEFLPEDQRSIWAKAVWRLQRLFRRPI